MMGLPRISWFMIVCGTPITLVLLMNYLSLANQKVPAWVFYSCLMECISAGIYVSCLIGVMLSRFFRFDLGVSWSDVSLIRLFSSEPILFMHPVSLLFIDWTSLAALTMTAAWIITVIDWKLHWTLFAGESIATPNDLEKWEDREYHNSAEDT